MVEYQRDLFDNLPPPLPPASSPADPDTSRQAEEEHTKAGTRRRNLDRVLALVRGRPGSTAVELWHGQKDEPGAVGRHEVSRRLADLAHAGLVRQGKARPCWIRERSMVTWWPAGGGTGEGKAG